MSTPTDKAREMKKWLQKTVNLNKSRNSSVHYIFDELAVAAAINDDIVVESKHVYGTVELNGKHTRGQMVWDWRAKTNQKPNIHLVTKINANLFKRMLFTSFEK